MNPQGNRKEGMAVTRQGEAKSTSEKEGAGVGEPPLLGSADSQNQAPELKDESLASTCN